MAKAETIADIVREMREFADTDSQSIGRDVLRRKIQHFADRLNTKSPENVNSGKVIYNTAKLREAVEAVVEVGYPHNFQREAPHIRGYCYDITKAIEKCFAALSAPPRNCDVGTAGDMVQRFNRFCATHRSQERGCDDCPAANKAACEFEWSQMPYEKGGVE